jgi:hypothetical protein
MIRVMSFKRGYQSRGDLVPDLQNRENENEEHLERITQRVNRLLEEAQSSRKVPNVIINGHISRKADKFLINLELESYYLLLNEFIHLFHSLKRYGYTLTSASASDRRTIVLHVEELAN